jgi:hypothetical protein
VRRGRFNYVLDQRETILEFGVRGAPETPFTPYKTFQTTIAAIEKLTQLKFTGSKRSSPMSLSAFDPLTQHKERTLPGGRAISQFAGRRTGHRPFSTESHRS